VPGNPLRLVTPRGAVTARHAVLTRGGYLAGLRTTADWRVMPVGTYVVATEPLGMDRITALIRENVAVADVNFVLDYFRRSADHRLLFGGRVSYSGIDARDTGRATGARMRRVFPQLAGVRLDYVWGGYVDISMNRAPDFGRIGGNLYYLQGSPGTASPCRAWRGGSRPKRSRARRSGSTSTGNCATACSRAAAGCARRR
jgi:gamma-glutamylputrescine oxidase